MFLKDVWSFSSDRIVGIISRTEFMSLEDDSFENTVLISISNPHSSKPTMNLEKFDNCLLTSFWDSTGSSKQVIDKKTAKEIKAFILDHKESRFLIHCSAGRSRSSAVAKAIECLLDFDNDLYGYRTSSSGIDFHKRYTPNDTVFKEIVNS